MLNQILFTKGVTNELGFQRYLTMFADWFIGKIWDLFICSVIVIVGFKIVEKIKIVLKNTLEKHKLETSVITFLISFVDMGLKVIFILWGVRILGVEMTSIVAILGSASIAIGLAVQGSLSNIAGGILILFLKPFRVGDYIVEDSKKNEGTVASIDIFYTKLYTIDNKTVIIPNGILANTSITNITKQERRRIELLIGISYTENMGRIRKVLTEIIEKEANIINEPGYEFMIYLDGFADSTFTVGVRAWAPTDVFWPTKWSLQEHIKERFDEEKIDFPFPQLDVHIKND